MRRFPFIRQHDSMQCGIACLGMVCRHYGRSHSIDELERLCPASREGVSMLGISNAATAVGLHTVCGRATTDYLRRAVLPCILHWRQDHFVVLYRVRRGRFYVADPAIGLVKYSREEFESNWLSTTGHGADKGLALMIETTPAFYGRTTGDGKTGDSRSLRFLMGYVVKYRRYFLQIIAGLLIGCLLQLALPLLTQSVVDVGITFSDIHFILLVLAGQFMLILGYTCVDFIRRWILLHIGMRINISIVSDFFIKLLRLPMPFFDTKLVGDIMQRMADHRRIETFLTGQVIEAMFSIVSFAVLGAVLWFYSAKIFVVFAIGSVAYAAWILLFLRRRKVLDYMLFEKNSENTNVTYQFVTKMQEIKLQGCEQRRRWEWEDIQTDLFGVNMRSLRLQQSQEVGGIFINELKNAIVTVVASLAVIDGGMTLGMMLAVQYIIGQLNAPVMQIMNFIYSLQDVRISLDRINEIHRMQPEDADGSGLRRITGNGDMAMNNVTFRYDPNSPRPILDGVTMLIPYGKVTAIVGASGSGKTTIMKLLLTFYAPQSGDVTLGDRPLRDFNKRWWRTQCGVVMQDGALFSESIARNIAAEDGEIDPARLAEAARVACIDTFIESLPLKYNTIIGDNGVGVSLGQKQRILIARAVYKNPDYIFLNEATNSLDANNERAIVDNLARFYRGRTVVVIAHRLSTVKNADQIIVLEKGRIVETGTNNELVARRGRYYELVKNQLELGS